MGNVFGKLKQFLEKNNKRNLLKKDQELMEVLVEKGNDRLKELQEIDQQLLVIQKSTKTTFSFFAPFHNYCRTKYKWYYNWHIKPYATKVHVGVLTLVLLSSLAISSLSLLSKPTVSKAAPVTVGTTTHSTATSVGYQRKVVYDSVNSVYWAFWHNGTAIAYAYSADGASWTASSTIAENTINYSLWTDGSTIYMASIVMASDVKIRKGAITASSITWDAPVTITTGGYYYSVNIALDTNKRIWAIYSMDDGGGSYPVFYKRSTNPSDITTWGIENQADTDSGQQLAIVPLASGDMYAIWGGSANSLYAKKYTAGTGLWSARVTVVSNANGWDGSIVSDANTQMHMAYKDGTNIKYMNYSSGAWQAAVTLDTGSAPGISIDTATNNLYAYYVNANTVQYKKGISPYASGNWDTNPTTIYSTGTNRYLTAGYQTTGSKAFLIWMNGAGSPYNIYFDNSVVTSSGPATRYWINNTSGNWNDTANWSATSGGTGGASVPVAGDTAVFDNAGSTHNGALTIDTAVNVGTLDFQAAYTGAITQGANTITTTTAMNLNGTSLTAGADITASGTLTIGTSKTLYINGHNITVTGAFTNNGTLKQTGDETTVTLTNDTDSGTVEYSATSGTRNIRTWTYYSLKINGVGGTFKLPATATTTVGGNFDVTAGTFTTNDGTLDRNITITGNATIAGTLTANASTLTVAGNWDSTAGTFTRGTSTVTMTGASKTITVPDMGKFYNLKISNSITFSGADRVELWNDLTVDTSCSLTISSGKTILIYSTITLNGDVLGTGKIQFANNFNGVIGGSGAISPSYTVFDTSGHNFTIPARTYGGNVTVMINSDGAPRTDTFGSGAGQTITINGYLYLQANDTGNFTVDFNTYNPTVNITGDFKTNGTGSGAELPNLGSGTWTVGGNVDFTNSTVTPGASTIDGNKSSGTQTFNSGGQAINNLSHSGAGTLQLSTNAINIDGDFSNSGGTFDANNLNVNLAGNWSNSGTFTANSGTVTFDGSVAQTITGATTWYNLTINNSYATPSDTYDVDPSAVQTVTNTLTVTDGQWTPYTGDTYKDVSIGASGILKPDASASISLSGNWANSGTFTANSGTVTFTASLGTTQTVGSNSNAFNVISHSSTGTIQLTDALTAVDLNITGGTFDANGQNISVSGNWNFLGGTFSAGGTPGSQTVNIIGTSETIFSGNTAFNILAINTTAYGAKSVKFTASSNQTIPNSGSLTLTGAAGKTLTLDRSGGTGADQWTITLPTNLTNNIFTAGTNITVSNSRAVNATITPTDFVTVVAGAGGNNTGWDFDTDAPIVSIVASPAAPSGTNSYYKTTAPTVAISATDQSKSGVASIQYRWGASGGYSTYSTAVTALEGTNTLYYYAVDNAGNTGSGSPSTTEYKVDTVAPVIDIAASPSTPNGTNSYYKTTAPTVTLSSSDATSGASTISYNWDGGSYASYSSALTPAQGTHTIYYYGVDNAGNQSAAVNREYKVDTATPTASLVISPAAPNGDNGYYKETAPTVTLSGSDATAGVASVMYRWGSSGSYLTYSTAITAPEGTTDLYYYAVDSAGNDGSGDPYIETYKVDITAPAVVTTPTVTSPTNNLTARFIWGESSDANSGFDSYLVTIGSTAGGSNVRNGQSTTNTYWSETFGSAGTYYIRVKAKDSAGNTSLFSTEASVLIETEAPLITISNLIDKQYIATKTITLLGTSSDQLAGLSNIKLKIDEGEWILATSTNSYANWSYEWKDYTEGNHTIKAKALDRAGNEGYSAVFAVTVDTTAPREALDFRVFNVSNSNSKVYAVYLDFADSVETGSGVKNYEIFKNKSKVAEIKSEKASSNPNYTGKDNQPFYYIDTDVTGGSYSYAVKATDNAGNISQTSAVAINTTGKAVEADTISSLKASVSSVVTKDKTSATVSWKTTYPATSFVEYGETTSYGKKTDLDKSLNQGHNVLLKDLKPAAAYHAKVHSKDIYGRELVSEDISFTTKVSPDDKSIIKIIVETLQGLFRILSAGAADSSPSAETLESLQGFANDLLVTDISFKEKGVYQNILTFPKGAKIEKGTDGKNFSSIDAGGNSYFLDKELLANTTYHYRADEGIAVARKPVAGDDSALTITEAEIIKESVLVAKDKVQLTVSWKTNRGAGSQVEFGASGSYGQKTKEDISLNMGHTVTLEDLAPDTAYHFRVASKDAKGNIATGTDFTFQTPVVREDKTPLDIILESLQRMLGVFGVGKK